METRPGNIKMNHRGGGGMCIPRLLIEQLIKLLNIRISLPSSSERRLELQYKGIILEAKETGILPYIIFLGEGMLWIRHVFSMINSHNLIQNMFKVH